ncbi:MAG: SDR family oxidoreductase [Planctomycetota bacterium]|nr:SDR family oxidoreductase [Planctomycetota bacterium]
MNTLSEKVCIVTGASSGIGEATALVLGEKGAKVVLAARRADRLDDLAGRIKQAGGEALPVACDVVDRGQVKSMVDRTTEAWGRIDVLINNAGIMPLAPLAKCRMDEWDAMIDINVKGLLYGIGFVLPVMLEQKTGHIVNVSSVAGRRVFPSGAVYCGTKYAVHAISEGLRGELSERAAEDGNQIRVTIIAPGIVVTELTDSIHDEETREAVARYHQTLPEKLTSEDIAASIVHALQAPPHVDINEILIRPTAQAR